MKIEFVEIGNFRKLKSVRIEFTDETTVFVGANNSGKTSAMIALRYFLVGKRDKIRFTFYDVTMSHWSKIDALGMFWENSHISQEQLKEENTVDSSHWDTELESNWETILPFLDVWLKVEEKEAYLVQKLIPTLDWEGGRLGVRLRLELKDIEVLKKDYLKIREVVRDYEKEQSIHDEKKEVNSQQANVLWPRNLSDYLKRRFSRYFDVYSYILDPNAVEDPKYGYAYPQKLRENSSQIEGDPFKDLIRIDEISAQRGFGQSRETRSFDEDNYSGTSSRKMSDQLRQYWKNHLESNEDGENIDIDALIAIAEAQKLFDKRLEEGFDPAFKQIEELGYPGITDPRLKVATQLKPIDGLNHDAAVQYVTSTINGTEETEFHLPEDTNGLGYQNLISIIFRLMSFRDAWIKDVNKKTNAKGIDRIPRLHLVLIEEPEAYLHAQVQQVFIRKAFEVIRDSEVLTQYKKEFHSQLIVSTHSSHVALECEFDQLRYFRRLLPLEKSVPTTGVVNLDTVFGNDKVTKDFVTRYIKVTHCDLLFADAAIFVEGPSERMLIPLFISQNKKLKKLESCYLTLLEIGGSHFHRFIPLIEELGLTTLIVTDLDAKSKKDKNDPPRRAEGQTTLNHILKSWCPKKEDIDSLLDTKAKDKIVSYPDQQFSIRVTYQSPVEINFGEDTDKALSNTFETALVLENYSLIAAEDKPGLWSKFKNEITRNTTVTGLSEALHSALSSSGKAEFALNLLELDDSTELKPPTYILEGLIWLLEEMEERREGLKKNATANHEEEGV